MMKLPEAFSPDVMAELAKPVMSYDPRVAEIVVDAAPKWHLLEVYEPAQRDVELELTKRRFGIFVPEIERTEIKRGRKITRKSPLFPGYIFLFVWDIARHWSRIIGVAGIAQIMASKPKIASSLPVHGKTVDEIAQEFGLTEKQAQEALAQARADVPQAIAISEDLIDEIRALENGARPIPRRRTRGKRKHDDDVIASYPWSAFPDRLPELDSPQRNQALRKALGLS